MYIPLTEKFSMGRQESVPSVALLQNDCAEGGLKFTLLGDYLYFIEGKAIYQVNWKEEQLEKVLFYESEFPLRHLTSNQHFIAVMEEGSGLVLIEADIKTPFCYFPDILEHYVLQGEVLKYNVGLDVYFINMEEDLSGHFITVDQPITQLIEDHEMFVIQMGHPRFHEATKLLYHLHTDETEVVGEEVKFVARLLSSKIFYDGSHFIETEAMALLDYGNFPRKVWKELLESPVEALAYYHEENYHFSCYLQDGEYWVALLENPLRYMTKLDARRCPDWFAVIGSLIVYFDGTVKWTRVNQN